MTCLKRLNKAGLELRPESTALAVHCLLPLVELCWAWGRGSGFHTRVRAQNPDGPVGRAGWVWGGGGVGRGKEGLPSASWLGAVCRVRTHSHLSGCIPTTACVDIPCLVKIHRLLCYFKVK